MDKSSRIVKSGVLGLGCVPRLRRTTFSACMSISESGFLEHWKLKH